MAHGAHADRRGVGRSLRATGLVLLALSMVPIVVAHAQESGATVAPAAALEALREAIRERVAKDVPSVAVAMSVGGRVIWQEAFGYADVEARIPATPATAYPIASVSKSVTATGVAVLGRRYGIPLDASIAPYVDTSVVHPLAGSLADITFRSLLNMSAGFPMGGKGVFGDAQAPDPIELLRHHGGLVVFPPGRVYHYANFSPSIAEPAIARATGLPFDEFMQREVFGPLGMTATFFDAYDGHRPDEVATYRANGSRNPTHLALPAAGGGARSSIQDLIRYATFHLGHLLPGQRAILSAGELRELHTPSQLSEGRYALGWGVRHLSDGTEVLVSNGWGFGAVARVQLVPQHDIAVVVVTNIRRRERDWYNQQFAAWVTTRAVDALVPGFAAAYEQSLDAEQAEPDGLDDLYPGLLGRWTGTVRTFEGKEERVDLEFRPNHDVHIQIGPQFAAIVASPRLLPGGVFAGLFPSILSNDEGYAVDHAIRLNLFFDGDTATGYFASNFSTQRGGFDLPSYVRFVRDAPAAEDTDRDAVRAAIDSGNAEYIAAYRAADARALAEVYDRDGARLAENGQLARGRETIAASVGRFLERVGPVRVRLETADVWVVGDQAYETGVWSYAFTPPGQEERTLGGRYVTVWRRQADGSWRMLADMGVPGTALPPPSGAP